MNVIVIRRIDHPVGTADCYHSTTPSFKSSAFEIHPSAEGNRGIFGLPLCGAESKIK
jgi:hypothetical protein